MRAFYLSEKQGFEVDSESFIFDHKMRPFLKVKPGQKMNAPAGLYYAENENYSVPKRIEPLTYKRQMRALRRYCGQADADRVPTEAVVTYGFNPGKCSVSWLNGKAQIFADSVFFRKLNKAEKSFIFFHEVGHFFFKGRNNTRKGEEKCDSVAAMIMIKNGFNPGQILEAMKNTLSESDEGRERIEVIKNLLK